MKAMRSSLERRAFSADFVSIRSAGHEAAEWRVGDLQGRCPRAGTLRRQVWDLLGRGGSSQGHREMWALAQVQRCLYWMEVGTRPNSLDMAQWGVAMGMLCRRFSAS